jgi:hypothetical protein
MDNSLYYTFSTIAQCLAALIGLLSAIALFRLQAVDGDLRARGAKLGGSFGSHTLLQVSLAEEDYKDFLAKIRSLEATGTVKFSPPEVASLMRMDTLLALKRDVTKALKVAFIVAGAVIAFSVAVLAHVHMLGDTQGLLWIGVGLLVLSLAFQTSLVLRILK